MKKILILVHDGFEEMECLTPIDLCRRSGIEVCLCSMTGDLMLHGAHGISVLADALFEHVNSETFDMVVLPGGLPGATSLRDDPRVIQVLQQFAQAGKWLSAICAAPIVLERAGLLLGRKATSYPGCLADETAYAYSIEPVVEDSGVITSRGVGTAILFALKIIEVLVSAEKANEISRSILFS